jgi:hypothetical protein
MVEPYPWLDFLNTAMPSPSPTGILQHMVGLGINPKGAALKADDVIDLTSSRRLGGDGK